MKLDNLAFYKYSFSFLNVYLTDQKGRSPNTVDTYSSSFTVLNRFLAEEKQISVLAFKFSDCTPDFVMEFLDWLKSEGNKEATRNIRLTCIKGYLEYAARKDVSLSSVYSAVAGIKCLRVPKREKYVLEDEQVAHILAEASRDEKGSRNRVMLLLLYDTAMRVSELTALETNQLYLDRKRPFVAVRGKGNKDRHIALSEKMAGILKTYIRKYHCGLSSYLFFTKSRGDFSRMSERNVQIMLQEYATKAREKDPSIPGHVHPHALRRARATGLYRNGMPIELVSSLLGHSQIETTRVYAKPSIEQMRQNMEKSIPEEAFRQKPVWTGKETEIKRLLGLK